MHHCYFYNPTCTPNIYFETDIPKGKARFWEGCHCHDNCHIAIRMLFSRWHPWCGKSAQVLHAKAVMTEMHVTVLLFLTLGHSYILLRSPRQWCWPCRPDLHGNNSSLSSLHGLPSQKPRDWLGCLLFSLPLVSGPWVLWILPLSLSIFIAP